MYSPLALFIRILYCVCSLALVLHVLLVVVLAADSCMNLHIPRGKQFYCVLVCKYILHSSDLVTYMVFGTL